jgi:hypothetical protein
MLQPGAVATAPSRQWPNLPSVFAPLAAGKVKKFADRSRKLGGGKPIFPLTMAFGRPDY